MFFLKRKQIRHVLVHQCGKVGSSSLTSTISASAPGLNVLQVHFITDHYLAQFREIVALPDAPADYVGSTNKLMRDAETARKILRDADPREICVISGCRDPLDRAVSALAQDFKYLYPELTYTPENHAGELNFLQQDFERLFYAVTGSGMERSFRFRQSHWQLVDSSLYWFEREFCPAYGLKAQIVKLGKKDLLSFRHRGSLFLLYRFETLRESMESLVRMLPLEEYRKVDKNVSFAKNYGPLLRDFRASFQPCPDILKYYYDSRFFRSFYPGRPGRFPMAIAESSARRERKRQPLDAAGWRANKATLETGAADSGDAVLRCVTYEGKDGVWGGMLLGCERTNVCDGKTMPCAAATAMELRFFVRGTANHDRARLALNVIDNTGARLAETVLTLTGAWTEVVFPFATRADSRFLGVQLVKAKDETPVVFEVRGVELNPGAPGAA